MKKSKYYNQDITFCMNKCKRKTCERNMCHIADKSIPHSFSYFKETLICPVGKQKETIRNKKAVRNVD